MRASRDVARGIVGWMTREMRAERRRVLLEPRRRQRGRGGQVLRLGARRGRARCSRRRAPCGRGAALRPRRRAELRGARVESARARAARRGRVAAVAPARRGRRRGSRRRRPRCSPRARPRVRPGLDDKILTSWNALAIAGLARAARALDEPAWADSRSRPRDALRRTAWRDGRLLATRKGERAHLNALSRRLRVPALPRCSSSCRRVFARGLRLGAGARGRSARREFEDPERGGFFFTSHDHERLFHRTKPGHDNATPSGNGIAAGALIALGHLCGEPRYVAAGERAVRLFAPALAQSPGGCASLLAALAVLQ